MTVAIHSLVSADASRVSRRCWSDPAVYELEKRGIFGRSWLFLGHVSQIPEPGDFVQACMGETPIILARGEDGAIHASVNSCTHRGLPVCRASHGNTRRFESHFDSLHTMEHVFISAMFEHRSCRNGILGHGNWNSLLSRDA